MDLLLIRPVRFLWGERPAGAESDCVVVIVMVADMVGDVRGVRVLAIGLFEVVVIGEDRVEVECDVEAGFLRMMRGLMKS